MSEAMDIKLYLVKENVKNKEDEGTWEALSGYVTYKGSPIMYCKGSRVKDAAKTTQEGRAYSYPRYTLGFYGTEEKTSKLPDETLFLRVSTNKDGSKRIKTEFHVFGDSRKEGVTSEFKNGAFAPSLFNIVAPYGGWLNEKTVLNSHGKEVLPIEMSFDDHMYLQARNKEETKNKYTIMDRIDLSDKELADLGTGFKWFKSFMEAFANDKEKVSAPAL